jgi:hypothetical protein
MERSKDGKELDVIKEVLLNLYYIICDNTVTESFGLAKRDKKK